MLQSIMPPPTPASAPRALNSQVKRIIKQQSLSRIRCLSRIRESTSPRTIFMHSDAARFLRQREWRKSLYQMREREVRNACKPSGGSKPKPKPGGKGK